MAEREYDDVEQKPVEAALASLAPNQDGLSRDRMLFEAGRASVRTATRTRVSRWLWPASTLVSTAAAVVLAMLLLILPRDVNAPHVASDDVPAPNPTVENPIRSLDETEDNIEQQGPPQRTRLVLDTPQSTGVPHYLILRRRVLSEGLDAFGAVSEQVAEAPSALSAQFPTQRELLKELLDNDAMTSGEWRGFRSRTEL